MKKIGFGLAMLLAGCVSDPAVTEGGGLTPVSAMPKGTATYDGRISRTSYHYDWEDSGFLVTQYQQTIDADLELVADFDNKSTTFNAFNASIQNDFYEEEVGVSDPIRYQNTGTYTGTANGTGIIDTDADGIYFNGDLNGLLTINSATVNGVVVADPTLVWRTTYTVDHLVSGYFTGATASGIYGRQTVDTGYTDPGDMYSHTDTITGTKR